MDLQTFAARFENAIAKGGGFEARCPCHDDNRNSLSIGKADNGGIVLHCHVGCATADIVAAKGLKMADLMPPINGRANGRGEFDCAYDYHDEQGALLYQSVRLRNPKGFYQRRPNGNGGWINKTQGVRRVLYNTPALVKAPEGSLVFTPEGERDVDNLKKLGLLATCNVGGAAAENAKTKWTKAYSKQLAGFHLVILPDNDKPGESHALCIAQTSYGLCKSIKIVRLPDLPEKGDVSDWLAAGGTKEELLKLVEETPEWAPDEANRQCDAVLQNDADNQQPDGRARILHTTKEHEVATESIAALAKLPGLYQRCGSLVALAKDPKPPKGIKRPEGSIYICAVDKAGLLDKLSAAAQFRRIERRGSQEVLVEAAPCGRIAEIILSRRDYPGVAQIEGIVRAPAFLADGGVLTTAGYDPHTGLYLAADCEFPSIPESPTLDDAQAARDELLEVVCDFPFANEPHRAAWLALAITPAARYAYGGPTPLGGFDANMRGTGKSKLADCIGMIHLGSAMPRTAYPTNNDEAIKTITGVLMAGERMMLMDNINGTLGGSAMDALLTAETWNQRILGGNKMTGSLPASTIWLASGNNLAYGADTARRALNCRIESSEENPEEREGFRHPDLLGWVRRRRARLAVACVTILRAYHVAGRPDMDLPEWGSFEGWSRLVRNAVVWCGMADPGETRIEVRQASDTSAQLLRQLLAAWESADPSGDGLTVSEAIELAADTKDHTGNKLLQAAFAELGSVKKPATSRSIGMKLHHLRGRVSGGRYFQRGEETPAGVVWKVVRPDSGTKGTKGTNSNPPTRGRAHAHAHAHAEAPEFSPSSTSSPTTDDLSDIPF